jgi:hypothetical protein
MTINKPWTALDEATVRAIYPEHGAEVVAHRLGRTVKTVHAKAAALGVKRVRGQVDAALRAKIAQLAEGPNGMCTQDLPEREQKIGHLTACKMVAAGKLFRGKLSHKSVRFFATQEEADAYVGARRIAGSIAPVVLSKTTTRARWAPDAPINYPKNPDGSPAYKHTVAPTPPAVVYRTNTHSVA